MVWCMTRCPAFCNLAERDLAMASGTVKKVHERGFGFISNDDTQADVYFHVSGMINRQDFDNLQKGDRVTFTIDNSADDGRQRAVDVRLAR